MINKRAVGDQAETIAAEFLKQKNYQLVAQNFQCRFGEIDLIMRSPDNEIIFIEVRYRKNDNYGGAVASITTNKQNKIRKTAEHYLQSNQLNDSACQFDVIAITQKNNKLNIDWITNAF